MAGYISSQGNEILINTSESAGAGEKPDTRTELVSWIIGRLDRWEKIRDQEHGALWKEYWAKVRGRFDQADKTRTSERSKIITPALAQAVEMTISEIEEALFSREKWIDAANAGVQGQNEQAPPDISDQVDVLIEDIDMMNGKDAIIEGVHNAAVFGTGILKVCTDSIDVGQPVRGRDGILVRGKNQRAVVYWDAIRADEFIPDPAGRKVKEMLGCGHRVRRPLHSVLEKIEQGVYLKSALADLGSVPADNNNRVDENERAGYTMADVDECLVDEWHGKVPAKFLFQMESQKSALDEALAQDLADRPMEGDGPLVEAIVTIANKSTLLRAMANPFVMKDRSVIAWPHEAVPGRFWGRGVAEKGINSQRALDAEVRARIDALGFISAPMLGIDSSRMPKNFKQEIFPGKIWKTNGNPNEILTPIKVGQVDGTTFNQAQDMERMVQMATGAFDTGSALGRSQTASGGSAATSGSLFMGAFVKRSKRAIQSLCRNAIYPLVEKTLWRYMEFDSQRYPENFSFVIKTTLGIVAREVEQLNLTQVMAMLPDEFPQVKIALAQGIVELATLHNKQRVMQVMEQALQGPDPKTKALQDAPQQIELETAVAQLKKLQAQVDLMGAQAKERETMAAVNVADAHDNAIRTNIEQDRTALQREENQQFAVQNDISQQRLELAKVQLAHKIEQDNKPKPAK